MAEDQKTAVSVDPLVKRVLVVLSNEPDAARVYKVNAQLVQYQKLRAGLLKVLEPGKVTN